MKSTIHETEITFKETVDFLKEEGSTGYTKITYGNWIPKEDLLFLAIIPYTKSYNKRDFIGELKNDYEYNLKKSSNEDIQTYSMNFLELLSNEFSKSVKNDYDYMISAIFTELLMNSKSVDGVFYPSIQSDDTCYNLAIATESVKKLSLMVVVECSIFKNKKLVEFCEDATAFVGENDDFIWTNSNTDKLHSEILHKIGVSSIEEIKSS